MILLVETTDFCFYLLIFPLLLLGSATVLGACTEMEGKLVCNF